MVNYSKLMDLFMCFPQKTENRLNFTRSCPDLKLSRRLLLLPEGSFFGSLHNVPFSMGSGYINCNDSLTWNKAILGWFPLLIMIPGLGRTLESGKKRKPLRHSPRNKGGSCEILSRNLEPQIHQNPIGQNDTNIIFLPIGNLECNLEKPIPARTIQRKGGKLVKFTFLHFPINCQWIPCDLGSCEQSWSQIIPFALPKKWRKWRVRFRPQDPIVDFHENHGIFLDFDTKKMEKSHGFWRWKIPWTETSFFPMKMAIENRSIFPCPCRGRYLEISSAISFTSLLGVFNIDGFGIWRTRIFR
jgi:hypothetical protein